MGSPLLGIVRLTVYLAWTALLIPVQAVLVAFGLPLRDRLPRFYHRTCCRIVGLRLDVRGTVSVTRPTLFVSNHSSYLDIMVLGALIEGSFVAKTEVGTWPLFGILAKLQRSVFIDRRRRNTDRHRDEIRRRLEAGDSLILFPEGTSSDGNRTLPFKSALFAAASIEVDGRPITVQPVSVTATRLDGIPLGRWLRPLYAWYGDMDLAPHLWQMVGMGDLTVAVEFHPPVSLELLPSRKALSDHCRRVVAAGVAAANAGTPCGRPARRPLEFAGESDQLWGMPRSSGSPDIGIEGSRRTVTKKLFIKTYGCQMNVYDSARMADVLAPLGYAPAGSPDDADMVILNTCHIREKATEKVFSDLGRLREHKRRREAEGDGGMVIAVAGCVAQAEGEVILERAPYVDMVFGPQTYHELPEMVARAARKTGTGILNTEFPAESKFDLLPEERLDQGVSAFLSIQEGCDKFCTFCVVPYTRGAEYSRTATQILDEARRLAEGGAREITLLGQNVNAFHGEGPDGTVWGLGRLVRALAGIEGVERIRYTTSHPRDMDDELIRAHAEVPELMPFLHLPVQSGSDRILAAMNRKHDADAYRRIVDRLRAARPDLALSSDFIVGFPGETDRDFADTLRLVTETGFAQAYSFKYSARPGTPASGLAEQVPETVKAQRLAALQQLIDAQQVAFNRRMVGGTVDVLFDRKGRNPGQLLGRSPYMQSVHVEAPDRMFGRTVAVRVTGAHANSLSGRVVMADEGLPSPGPEREIADAALGVPA